MSLLRRHLAFVVLSGLAFLVLFALLRAALLAYNWSLAASVPAGDLLESFGNGLRFDARVAVCLLLPLIACLFSARAMKKRGAMRAWCVAAASFVTFLGVVELDFYREFQQRLNGLVFQYLEEDPATVLSMLWHGFPVLRLLLAWALAAAVFHLLWRALDRRTRPAPDASAAGLPARIAVFVLCAALGALAARGTLRQGPPLRWGDAFTTDSMFANQLGFNGTLSFVNAARQHYSKHRDNAWRKLMPEADALALARRMLLTAADTLVDAETAAARRDFSPAASAALPVKNVVVVLMESFAARHVGALGATDGVTPHFDRLAREEGLLFTRFFSSGTHTHQGMFASMACFPNLPGFEYLMQTPEGGHRFSGLPRLLSARGYDNVYVYNGDFAWDNQYGFFGNQGMTRFVGRKEFVNPVFSDPTWGVSDQDMFARAGEEIDRLAAAGKPFYALAQTLSNHTPYALPDPLPVERVTGQGALDEHLTAMRYSDWALGQFFEHVRKQPYYRDTLFVVLGDHGFADSRQLTEMNLFRFHVPLLLVAPGIREKFGATRDTVGSQVDVVPTIMGRLGGETRHQCWGRDLLQLPPDDAGFAVFKPSGGEQVAAIASGDRLFAKPRGEAGRLYRYRLGAEADAARVDDPDEAARLQARLEAYVQTATKSLLENTAGARE